MIIALDAITGEQLKVARMLLGWSEYDLADEARLITMVVLAYENGWQIPNGLFSRCEKRWRKRASNFMRAGHP
jgi:hypothetical protein